jgi:hypothetical protein
MPRMPSLHHTRNLSVLGSDYSRSSSVQRDFKADANSFHPSSPAKPSRSVLGEQGLQQLKPLPRLNKRPVDSDYTPASLEQQVASP